MKLEKITFEAEPQVKAALESLAKGEERSLSSLLRRMVKQSLQERTVESQELRAAATVSEVR